MKVKIYVTNVILFESIVPSALREIWRYKLLFLPVVSVSATVEDTVGTLAVISVIVVSVVDSVDTLVGSVGVSTSIVDTVGGVTGGSELVTSTVAAKEM